jgi:Ca2+-binding RTX toxin-like protein
MHFSERQRQELSKARKRRLARQRRLAKPSPAFEQLEPRIVLSGSPLGLTSAQVAALSSGFTSLAQRLTEAQASDLLASSAVGIGQPLGTLISVGDELRTGLTDPLAVALSGPMNVAQIETAISSAVAADDFLSTVGINTTEATNASGDTVVWFTLSVTGSETLADYELDLGQAGIDGAQGILREQGLAVDAVEVDLDTTLAANFAIGVTLAAGLTANEMICLKSDSIEVGATASGTVSGIDARFGAIRLGEASGANISLAVDLGVELDLQEDTDGCLSLGSLDAGAVGDIFSQVDVSTDFDVTIPFDLDIGGFDLPTGTGLNITLGSPDLLDASQLNLTLPSLTIGSSPFDFGDFGNFSINDVGSLLDDLSLWIPEIGTGFELPLIGLDVADLFGDAIDLDWDGLFGGLKSPEGEWTFDTLQELDEFLLNSSIGASIGLTWNPNAEAIEWTLPLSFSLTETAGFDSGELIPDGLPLSVAANGELNVTMTGNLSLTAGVAITSSANVNPVNGTTLLTEINGGFGLTSGMLIDGDDLEFTLRDGTVVGVNLSTLDLANGTATVLDLLNLVNTDPQASGNLTLAVNASALVATDLTTPASASATFSIAGPSVNVTIGNTPTIQTSLAPIALGLLVAPTTDSEIQGSTLEGFSLRDRLYLKEGEISSLTLAVEGGLEGGAALGPLSLSIYCGAVEGGAGVALNLVDPGTGAADDGRIYLSEMDAGLDAGNTGVTNLMDYSVTTPTLDGIFQLRVTPEELEQTLDIDFAADYLDYCGNISLSPSVDVPNTTLVPYLQLDADLDAEGWSFTIEPSEKLSGVLAGLGDFSLDDLPAMLDFFVSYLEGSDLWDFEIPWIDVSLGDVFGFVEIFANLPEFDLGDLFGRPTSYDGSGDAQWPDFSFGDLGGDFVGSFELALPDLSGLGSFDRLQPLIWTLDDLIVEWEGWTPGDSSYDLDFLGRMRAWFSDATLAFPELGGELNLSLAGPAQNFALDFGRLLSLPQFRWEANASAFNANLDASWLGGLNLSGLDFPGLDFGGLDSLEFELGRLFIPESEGGHLPDSLSLPDGINISLTPSLTVDQKLALDLNVTLVDASYTKDLTALSIDGFALDITGSGNLTLAFDGSLNGRVEVDLSNGELNFDSNHSGVSLNVGIDSGSGLILAASLGGLVGVGLGKSGDEAWVRLSDGSVTGAGNAPPATLGLLANGTLAGDAVFEAYLPLYVDAFGADAYVGAIDVEATLALEPTPSFNTSFDYNGTGTNNGSGGEYQSLGDVLANPLALFSFDGWLDGAAQFVSFLRTALASDLTADLPLIGGIDVSDGSFIGNLDDFLTTAADIDSPYNLSANLSAEFGSWGAGLSADFGFSLDGVALNSAQMNTSFESLLTADAEFVVDLTLASTTTNTLASADLDFGIESLGLAVEGDADIYLNTSLALNIGLGASLTRGFFIETDEDTEFTAGLSLALPADLSMRLGPLSFDFEDATAADELEANLTVDFGNQSYGLTQLPDLFANINIGGSVRAEVGANLTASLFGGSGPGLGVSLAMGFNEEAQAGGSAVSFENLTTNTADKFFFEITDTYIDLGGLLSGPVGEIFSQVDSMLEPLRPVLDLLTSEIPVLSDISKMAGGGAVTVLDAMRIFGDDFDKAATFIETVDSVSDTIAALGAVTETSRVSLGGFTVDDADKASFLGATSASAGESAINTTAATANPSQNISADPATSSVSETYSGVTGGSLSFPIFEDPTGVLVDLLFGGNPNLVYWDMPDLVAGFKLSQSFPIFPPLFVKFFGGFEFTTDFALGYDTRGIRQAMEGGLSPTQMAGKMLNGVFLDDVNADGFDKPELTFTATVGAGAELNVVVAKAGVDAGVRGTLGANLKDNNNDGKVHLDEFVANLRSGLECIFDLEGSIDAFLEAYIKVGLSTPFGFVTLWSDRFELVDVNLFEWNHISCPPVEPTVAEVSGSKLLLNTGPRAGLVLPGETEDGDEEFVIDYDATRSELIVRAYDVETDLNGDGAIDETEKGNGARFPVSGITTIEFDAGLGDDIIIFTENIPATISVIGAGGPGNDMLTGAPGKNTFYGDDGDVIGAAGSDRLIGRASDDEFHGGGENDILYGYGGSDVLHGDSGADQIIGDDEVGDLTDAPDGFGAGTPGNDEIYGGDDGDMIFAGHGKDVVDAGGGDDTVDGGADDDTIEGGSGNDKVYGRAGNDVIWGDDQAGAVSGSDVNVNADLIEGGDGYNIIYGGPGYDIIYAMSEADGVLASPGVTASYTGSVSFITGNFASWVDGGDGNDSIYGTAERDYLAGGFEADYIVTGDGGDVVNAGPGNDGVIVAAGNAEVYLGDGNDIVDGGDGENWIEGGPGDDKIFARGGSDTVYGGSTARSYELRQIDLTHRAIVDPLHGGFSATVAAESCEPDVVFHPEVYPPAQNKLAGIIFEDVNANGVYDTGDRVPPEGQEWRLRVGSKKGIALFEQMVSGGEFSLPENMGLPDGETTLTVTKVPSGWFATTAVSIKKSLPTAASFEFGFYRNGAISGIVQLRDTQTSQDKPAEGARVFLDLDSDGVHDYGEPTEYVDSTGRYVFEELMPADYQVFVEPPAAFQAISVSPVPPAFIQLGSGESKAAPDFLITGTARTDTQAGSQQGTSAISSASIPMPSGAVTVGGVIQGSVWWHDNSSSDQWRTSTEQGLNNQTVSIVGQGTGFTATTTTSDLDLNGDGLISDDEIGSFRFSGLASDAYVVTQQPIEPWVQVTHGATVQVPNLISVTYDDNAVPKKSAFSEFNPVTGLATTLFDITDVFAARDIAVVGERYAYVTGRALASTSVTPPGKGGLWQVDLGTQAWTDLGQIPGGYVIVALEALDEQTLVGIAEDGEIATYDLISGSWTGHGPLKSGGKDFVPVGDLAAVAPGEIYAVLYEISGGQPLDAQHLAKIDITSAAGVTTTLLRQLGLSAPMVGLEVSRNGLLIGLDSLGDRWELPLNGPPVRLGWSGIPAYDNGGLAGKPATRTPHASLDFVVELQGGDKIDVGFGNEPDYELLPDGDDFIDGGCGNESDRLYGDDFTTLGATPQEIADLSLDWWIVTEGGNDRIRGRRGDDKIYGGQQGDYLYGDEGLDTLVGGDTEFNRILGGDDDDTITGGAARDVVLGQAGNDNISTLGGNDSLDGGEDDDTLYGGDDNDTLIGGPGADEVYGQNGTDLLVVIDTSLTLAASFATPAGVGVVDLYDGGNGTDTLALVDNINLTLTDTDLLAYGETHGVASIEHAYLVGGAGDNTFDAVGFSGTTEMHGQAGNDTLSGGSGVDEIYGGDDDDTISGNGDHDWLEGQRGNDTITGGAGNDTLQGGSGNNSLSGEAGDDKYLFWDVVANDTVDDIGGGSDVADFTAFTSDLTLAVGNATAPVIIKQGSRFQASFITDEIDTVLLGNGNDTLQIKEGNSTIASVDAGNGTDLLTYQGGASGWAAWNAGVTVSLAGGTATGFTAVENVEDVDGGDGDDSLTGSDAANRLSGYGGNDVIAGLGGDDVLSGWSGNDVIAGGGGNDRLNAGEGVNTLAGGLGDDEYTFFDHSQSDTVNENPGEGNDRLDFSNVTTDAVTITLSGLIHAVVNNTTVTAANMNAFEAIRGGSHADQFVIADGTTFGGSLDGGGVQGSGFADMNILDLSAWTTPVTVDYTGQVDALSVESASAVTGGVIWLQHVIGGSAGDSFTGGDQSVWFEGRDGDDVLTGSSQGDRLAGGLGNDTMSGGDGDDFFMFADLFGNDLVNEGTFAGTDTMDFSAVTAPLEVVLGSVTVSDGSSVASHAGSNIEQVIGGAADDTFVMSGPNVTFPGTLDGSSGNNTLWYDNPDVATVASVEANGTPGINAAINFAAVNAIEWQENDSISGPVLLGTDYDGEVYVNPATPVTYAGSKVKTAVFGGQFELMEAEAVPLSSGGFSNKFFARSAVNGFVVTLPADGAWALTGMFGLSVASTPLLIRPDSTPSASALRLPIELNGLIDLRRDLDSVLYVNNGTTTSRLEKDGDVVTQTIEPGYRILGAEQVGGVNQVLLVSSAGNGFRWVFNASWSWVSEISFSAGSTDAKQAELDFELDFNLDGTIGS